MTAENLNMAGKKIENNLCETGAEDFVEVVNFSSRFTWTIFNLFAGHV
jgi:hypothetical protein